MPRKVSYVTLSLPISQSTSPTIAINLGAVYLGIVLAPRYNNADDVGF